MTIRKPRILVTGTGGRSVGSGILHALLRSSSDVSQRWEVVAADADTFAWGLYKVPLHVVLPMAGSEHYLDRIADVVREHDIKAIIPGTEAEVEVLQQHAARFRVPIIANRLELLPLMMDKFATGRKLVELNLPSIPTAPLEQWESVVKRFGYPVVIKPTRHTGGSRGVSLAINADKIRFCIAHIDPSTQPCLQPYIGDGEHEYTVGVLSDRSGRLIDSIVMRRQLIGLSLLTSRRVDKRVYALSTGYSQGFFEHHPRIQQFCEHLALKLDSRGPLNIQLRTQGEEIFVFEIHPRFSGTTPMRADVGFNEADLLLRNHLHGESFGRLGYKTDVAVIRAFEHIVVPMDQLTHQ